MEDKNVSQVKDTSEDDDNKRLVSFMLEYDEAIAEFLDNYDDDQDMLVTVEAATENAIRCNKALIETLGYGKEEIVGQSIFNLYHRDGVKDAKELFGAITKTGAIRDAKQTLRKSDGSKLTVSLNATTVRDTDGKVTSAQFDWRDFTLRESELAALRAENRRLAERLRSVKLKHPEAFTDIVTQDPVMLSIFRDIELIAVDSGPVLITGETGVGKEKIAEILHQLSGRSGKYVPINIGGTEAGLVSDTLFGHVEGAYTDARSERRGMVEQASGGTLFLDEIGDLAKDSQTKLLRLLDEGVYYHLGSDEPVASDIRTVAATNRTVQSLMSADDFRDDFYYRLRAHHIHLPPLRERKDDIPLLVAHFLRQSAKELNKKTPTPTPELITLLKNYHFPGNIRELQGMVRDAVTRHEGGVLSMDAFLQAIEEQTSALQGGAAPDAGLIDFAEALAGVDRLPSLQEVEPLVIAEALRRADDNRTLAAQLLGLTRKALSSRLSRSKNKT